MEATNYILIDEKTKKRQSFPSLEDLRAALELAMYEIISQKFPADDEEQEEQFFMLQEDLDDEGNFELDYHSDTYLCDEVAEWLESALIATDEEDFTQQILKLVGKQVEIL